MSKRICIIGGASFVGRAIARQAVDAGHQVTITTRHPARARDMNVKGIQVKVADIVSGKGLDDAFKNTDCVINLVGLLFESGRNTIEADHIEGVKNICVACENAEVPQLLHLSALLNDKAIQENSYAKSKCQAEDLIKATSLQWTIFRPSIIFGANDAFLMRLKSLSSFSPFLPVLSGNTKFQPVWVEDVARAFVLSIANSATAKHSYTLAGDQVYTFKEIINMWLAALGRKRMLLSIPNLNTFLLVIIAKLLPTPFVAADQLKLLKYDNTTKDTFPDLFGRPASFKAMLPVLAGGGQATLLQQRLDHARTHYRKS